MRSNKLIPIDRVVHSASALVLSADGGAPSLQSSVYPPAGKTT